MENIQPQNSTHSSEPELDLNWGFPSLGTVAKVTAISVFAIGGTLYFITRSSHQEKDEQVKTKPFSTQPTLPVATEIPKKCLELSDVTSIEKARQYLNENNECLPPEAKETEVVLLSQAVQLVRLSDWLTQIAQSSERWKWAFTGFGKRDEQDIAKIAEALSPYVESSLGGTWQLLCLEHDFCCKAVWIHYQDNKITELVEKAWNQNDWPATTARFGVIYCTGNENLQKSFIFHMDEDQEQTVLVLGVAHQILKERKGAAHLIDPLIKEKGIFSRKVLMKGITQLGDLICLDQAGKKHRSYRFLETAISKSLGDAPETYELPKDPGKVPFGYEYLSLDLLSPDHILDVVVTLNTIPEDETKSRCHPKCLDLLFYYAHHKKADHYLAALRGLCKLPFAKILGNDEIRKSIKELVRDEPFKSQKQVIAQHLTASFENASGLSKDMRENLRVLFRDDLQQEVPNSVQEVHFEN